MVKVRLNKNGALVLPADMLRRHGIRAGAEFIIEDDGDTLRLRPVMTDVAEAQALARRLTAGTGASVEQFLAERRRDSGTD
jgi:bifunctional DNA-binding transcriptional regulator/antitoxin component of YhaV-PrlF toxin-antitoxin module